MPVKIIPSSYHQQDTDYYCGAATAQMILYWINDMLRDQDLLYTLNHNHNTQSGWATDPDGLCYTLNKLNSSPHVAGFAVYRFDQEVNLTWIIIHYLSQRDVPFATLVYGCGHWIVVKGYSTDVDPNNNNNFGLYGLYIDNPWPPSPGFYNSNLTPPPHEDSDGCGTGGNRGIANEYVTYSMWQSTYMTGCDVWNVGHKQFVGVGYTPQPPSEIGEITTRREIFSIDNELKKDADISKALSRGIELHKLKDNELFAEAMRNAKPAKPILVQRLDKADTYYYLVPMEKDNNITAVISVDGIVGEFQGGVVVQGEKGWYISDKEGVLNKVLNTPIHLPNREGMLKIREGTFCFHPIMVWKPCEESRSPYYPFHMITVGSTTLYIGYDGMVYTQLHDLSKG